MKKIIITGGSGFIGTNCAYFFLKKKFKILIYDNLKRKSSKINLDNLLKNKNITFVKGDISNFYQTKKNFLKFKPDIIINCAGQVAVTTSIIDPQEDFNSNALGCFNQLEIIRKYLPKTKFIHLSTNKVYGDMNLLKIKKNKKKYILVNNKNGIDENHPLSFHSPYGCSKGAADQYVIDYRRIYNLKTFCIRQSCIYGPYQYGLEDQGWVAWIILRSILNKQINIYGDGKQVRDILYVDDLVKLFYQLFINNDNKIKNNYFNCGGGTKNSISIIELIEILEKKLNRKINYKYKNERKSDQKIFISDNSKLKKYIGWTPKTNKEIGIENLYNWININLENFKKIYGK